MGDSGFAVLVDEERHLVSGSHNGAAPGDRTDLEALAGAMKSQGNEPLRLVLGGEPYLVYRQPIPSARWRLALLEKEAAVLKEVHRSNRAMSFMLVGLTILCIFITLTLRKTILNPIRNLMDVQGRIALGESDARARILFNDELGELLQSFNRMADSLATAGRRLRESEMALRGIFTAAPVAITLVDAERNFKNVNETATLVFGYEQSEMISQNARLLYHNNEEYRLAGDILNQKLEQGDSSPFEIRFRHKNGNDVFGLVSASKLQAGDPQLSGIVVIVLDITERKRSAEALRAGEDRFRSIVENVGESIILVDETGTIIEWNPGSEAQTGLSRTDTCGRKSWDVFSDLNITYQNVQQTKDELRLAIENVLKTGVVTTIGKNPESHATFRRSDGQVRHIHRNASAIRTAKGFMLLFASRDITDQWLAQETIKKGADELTALYRLVGLATSRSTIETAGQAAVEKIGEVMNADLTLLFGLEDGRLVLKALSPPPMKPAFESAPVHRIGECLCGLAVSTGLAVYSPDIHQDSRCSWPECRKAGLRSYAALPLLLGEEVVGVLGTASFTERNFQEDSLFLETAADQLAISIHNVRLLEQTRDYAQKLEGQIEVRELAETALRQSELELQRVNDMLRKVLDAIPVRVFWKDRNGVFLGCNPPFALDAGKDRPEMVIGQDDFQINTPELAEMYRSQDFKVMESGKAIINFEEPQILPNGDRRLVQTSKIPLRSEDGEVFGLLGVYEDITERKMTEEKLRESELKYKSLFENANDGIFILNQDATVQDCNRKVLEMFRLERQDIIGRSVADFSPQFQPDGKRSRDKAGENISAVLDGTARIFDWSHFRSDGTLFEAEVSLSRLPVEGDRLFLSVIRDITDRKMAEEALRSSEAMLRGRFSGRTHGHCPVRFQAAGPGGQ